MIQGRTAVGRAMLEGRTVGNRTKVIKKGDDKDSREMVESQAVRDNIINIE
jgi:hypothetical protein